MANPWNFEGKADSPESQKYLQLLDKHVQYYALLEKILDLKPGMKVLDAGCGTGDFLNRLATQYPDVTFYGLDIAFEALSTAKKNSQAENPANFFNGPIELPAIRENSLGVVYTSRVIQHLQDPLTSLEKLVWSIKPGGRLVLAEPNWGSLEFTNRPELTKQFQQIIQSGQYLKHPYIALALKDLLQTTLGLESTQTVPKTDQASGGPLIAKIFNFDRAQQVAQNINLPTEFRQELDTFATDPEAMAELTMIISTGTKPYAN